jgi:hypothetical protein
MDKYLIHTETEDNDGYLLAEYQIYTDNKEVQLIVAIIADDDSTRPTYSENWPGWDGKTLSYYIEDINRFRQIAEDNNLQIEVIELQ